MSLVRLAALALVVAMLVVSSARAQPPRMRPSAAEWSRAEATLRAHAERESRAILELTRQRAMGTTFWVRWQAGGGGLVVVRGDEVLSARGDATVARVLQLDRFVETRSWGALELLQLVRQLGEPIPLERDVIGATYARAFLRPRLEHGPDGARLVLHAFREGPPEAEPERRFHVTRAVLTVDPAYALAWSHADVVLDARGRER
ncbi:hypothetical protein [Sandaracinus amylolyticus]|uniref:Outer membrane lipoprotein carrier protein LolA n=1 Tax=Sandaracinus amylolyticus TaxID=927083 RepID=A0A0F6W6E6_9BACT|nr:hypothetical protein [Sandaracinus amylolyticus]AKF08490.1 hypothetical protein DB32_005639 [Sandaracinus amylolyticus]